jgi:predicted enzyme related to lactoylglutathione lyase
MEGKSSGGGGTLVYFPCEDCAVTAHRVVKNGGSIMREKFAIGPYGFISLVVDTEGNVIGLHSMG